MNIRAFALSIAIPIGIVTFIDRYPALVHEAANVLRATLATF